MIQEAYVSFEIAKLLKEKGFDEQLEMLIREDGTRYHADTNSVSKKRHIMLRNSEINMYSTDLSCPTLQMAMKWLREVHKIHINTVFLGPSLKWTPTIWKIDVTIPESKHLKSTLNTWDSYEDACEAAIQYCLTNLI